MVFAEELQGFNADDLVLVAVPRFFNEILADFDARFHFIGFIPEGRDLIFEPWRPKNPREKPILVSSTTGMLPQIKFCELAVKAFANSPWNIVLSIAGAWDPISDLAPESLALPSEFEVTRSSSNFEILKSASLFVGQGGQGSTLEAIYHAVPSLLVSPSQFHDVAARRVAELGLGIRVSLADVSPKTLREAAASLMSDDAVSARLKRARNYMLDHNGAQAAANLIQKHIGVA